MATTREKLIEIQDELIAENDAFEARIKAQYLARLAAIQVNAAEGVAVAEMVEAFTREVKRNQGFGSGIVRAVNGAMADVVFS